MARVCLKGTKLIEINAMDAIMFYDTLQLSTDSGLLNRNEKTMPRKRGVQGNITPSRKRETNEVQPEPNSCYICA